MPDLERLAVMDWIAVCEPAIAHSKPPPIRAVEEEADTHAALIALGRALDLQAGSGAKLAPCLQTGLPGQDLMAVLTQIGPARLLRLLDWLGTGDDPDRTVALRGLLAGDYAPASALQATFQALHRQELLNRMFSESRLALLLAATTAAQKGADA
jgi:hypothetical protein